MVTTRVKKKRSKRRHRQLWLLFFLLAGAGAILYKIPPSHQDFGRIVQSVASKFFQGPAGQEVAGPALRGTVYDRNFREMAVSYRQYSLVAHPAEVRNRTETAASIAQVIGEKQEVVALQLKSGQRTVELADDLDEYQANLIRERRLNGISCRENESRFYPGHEAAAHILGFIGDGVGLAGIEGKYDTVLQPGEYRKNSIDDIDFDDRETLGRQATDILLTIDLEIQKSLESKLKTYLQSRSTRKGMGLVIEPGSGRILALTNQPAFNPNYFWQADDSIRVNRMYKSNLDKSLIRPLLVRGVAIQGNGLSRRNLLPETIAAPDYGVDEVSLDGFERQLGLNAPVINQWESGSIFSGFDFSATGETRATTVTGIQMGITLASLVNGGWRFTPYVLDSIYDHATASRYHRDPDATIKSHVLQPAIGVKMRRELFPANKKKKNQQDGVYTAEYVEVVKENGLSRYVMQELYIGLVPRQRAKYLVMMAVEREQLYPQPPANRHKKDRDLASLGGQLLAALSDETLQDRISDHPKEKSKENLHQFFISKRLDFQQQPVVSTASVIAMPQLTGLSLRKGLQHLNQHKVTVRINGTGTIVAQYPTPGESLNGVDECVLTLESSI